jgi:hypothetical protein
MDWEALSGALPVVLWILFLLAKKRKQKQTQEKVKQPEGIRRGRTSRRSPDPQEFKRDYEPIEPS